MPADLEYAGAFRLPDESGGSSWMWCGEALAYHAGGDPQGEADGHPGSLFGVGHDHQAFISEISIPRPVVSKAKNVEELPVAKTLQPFADIRGGLFKDYEMYRCGLAVLTPPGAPPQLWFEWGQHLQDTDTTPAHGFVGLDLAKARVAGPWSAGGLDAYRAVGYMDIIPEAWAAAHAPGMRLVTGRFRDGGQGGRGPTLWALAPPAPDALPAAGSKLPVKCLLQYSTVTDETTFAMKDYHDADDWAGVAWLTAGAKSAVVFVGTKGTGKCWYGFANGVVWPEEGPWPEVPPWPSDARGWWSTGFKGQMLFYATDDLAAVAAGRMKPHEPQPYATLDIDTLLFNVKAPQQKTHVRDCAFDPQRGLLYVTEFLGDGDKSLVHVWRVRP
jgi:hypothetical protein